MSENYLYVAGLEHSVSELEELLREARPILRSAFFGNWKEDKAAKELLNRIDNAIGEEHNNG